jgi:hypothetical protein
MIDILTLLLGGFGAWIAGMIVIAVLIAIAFYIYTSFAWMTIAKRLGYDKAWLAWIPVANFFLYPILAKKRWEWGFIFLVPIANIVFYFIWTWNIFEQRKFPGWLSLIPILGVIPMVSFVAVPAYLVVLGFVAWKK